MKHKKSKDRERSEEEYDVDEYDNDRAGEVAKRLQNGGGGRHSNGHYRAREVDVSQIPNHLLERLIQAKGSGTANLSAEEAEGSAEDGAWIIQCPKDVDLSSTLTGKKISLNGNPTVFNSKNEENAEDTGRSSAGPSEIYETVATPKEDVSESVLMLLPESESGFKIVSVPLKGYISVRLHVDEIDAPEIILLKKKKRKLPPGIKERHCFMREKMINVSEESPKKNKKKAQEMEDSFVNDESLQSPKKRKRKAQEMEDSFVNDESPKKKKRKAQELEDHFVYDESSKKKKNKK